MKPVSRRDHAILIGGSLAGLLAARVLADHFSRVTILERDRLPTGPEPRKGTPQARHVHALLTAGRRVIDRLLPGFSAELLAAGAVEADFNRDVEWIGPPGAYVRFASDLRILGMSRDLLEWTIRHRVLEHPRITVRGAVDVTGLLTRAGRVEGVTLEDRSDPNETLLMADLVIDAAGRASRSPQWLEAQGFARPRETHINGFVGYASRTVRLDPGQPRDWVGFYIQTAPPTRSRGGLIAPIENGLHVVTLVGGGKDYPPTDEAGFLAFARSLVDPRLAAALESAEPLTPIVGTKSTDNRIRHYEEIPSRPEGYLITGDAACAFNPVYGQGMSTAALGAEILDRCLKGDPRTLASRFQKDLAASNRRPWLLATGEDYRYPAVEGPQANWATCWMHSYLDRLNTLATHSPTVRRKLTEVLHMIRTPASLFTPDLLVRAALTRLSPPAAACA